MRDRFRSESGLTLIELIIVLVLIGLITVLVLPRGLRQAANSAALDAESQKLAGIIRLARQKSMTAGTSYNIKFDGTKYTPSWYTDDDEPEELDSHINMEFSSNVLQFQPNGHTSDGYYVILTDGADQKKLTISSAGTVNIEDL